MQSHRTPPIANDAPINDSVSVNPVEQTRERGRPELFTIGHSALPAAKLLELLRSYRIDTVVDVRSQPYSRLHPQHSRAALRDFLKVNGVRYAFMGDTLGGRPKEARHYDAQGHVNYSSWAGSADFQVGLARLTQALRKYRVALLCSEEDPRQCHRHLLIARALMNQGLEADEILHIRSKGTLTAEASLAHQVGLEGERSWKSPLSVLHKVLPNGSSSG